MMPRDSKDATSAKDKILSTRAFHISINYDWKN